jgi:hypothetical protein
MPGRGENHQGWEWFFKMTEKFPGFGKPGLLLRACNRGGQGMEEFLPGDTLSQNERRKGGMES